MIQSVLQYFISLPAAMPEQIWFFPFLILCVLAWTAFVDARTGRVPNVPLAIGAVVTLLVSIYFEGQFVATQRAVIALAVLLVLWVVNTSYYRVCKRDAFGFGDVKWSALAAMVFGMTTIFWAWCVAAWLGIIWIVIRKLLGAIWPRLKGGGYIHFAPFLFIGLLAVKFIP